jgi:uncharacterized membrane protein YbhN (UPF0104 family)
MGARRLRDSARRLERFLDGGRRVTKTLTRWALPLAILALLAWLAARQLDPGRIGEALRAARWPEVALAALLAATVCMGALILRLYTLLQALPHAAPVTRLELASIHFASSAAHNVLPAPAGEVLRTVQLKRRHGYELSALVVAQLIEKLVEMLGLGLGTLAVAALGGLRGGVGASMFVLAALAAGGAAVALVIGWRWRPSDEPYLATEGLAGAAALRAHAANFFRRLGEGMHQLRSPWVWLRALGWSMLSDAANAVTVGLCLGALGVSVPLAGWFLAMLAARGAGVVPSTPGQFGVQEAAVVGALALVGVDGNRALAVALLHHMAHFIPVTAIGLVELRRQWVPKQVEMEL